MPEEVKKALKVLEGSGHLNLKNSMEEHPRTAEAKKVVKKFLERSNHAKAIH